MAAQFKVLLLPGWLDSGAGHWQTLWEERHGDLRVVQHDYQCPRRGDWMARLEDVLLDVAEPQAPVLLAAHSLGCHLVAAWAEHSSHRDRVCGALLVAPPDTTHTDWPTELYNWRKPVLTRLPFPSTVIASTDDPFGSIQAQSNLAQAWGSRIISIGARGHINSDSGLANWPQGRDSLLDLQREAVHGH